jgi:hypothetical protein
MNDNYEYEYDLEEDYGQAGPTEEEWRAEIEKDLLLRTDRANINNNNNIKNNKDNKDIKTFNDSTSASDNQELIGYAPLASASQKKQGVVGQKKRGNVSAAPWNYLKIDLFDNADINSTVKGQRNFKLKLSFIYPDGPNQTLSAGMNTEWRFAKRGFDFNDPDDLTHYNLLETVYRETKDQYDNVRVSKCYDNIKGQKGRSVVGESVILSELPTVGEYLVTLVEGIEVYDIRLSNKDLTAIQRKNNCIASGHIGESTQLPKLTNKSFHSRGKN